MVVGHLTYAPFMLFPAFCACLLPPPGTVVTRSAEALRCLGAGMIVAIAIQAGMVHIIPPGYLAIVALLLMHALRFGAQRAPYLRLAAATTIGLAVSAGKLAASLALLSHFPRDDYPLPGIQGFFHTAWIALQTLFLLPTDAMSHAIVNSHLVQEQHEFEYGVSIAPLLLLLAAGARLRRAVPPPGKRLLVAALSSLLLVPIALNVYQPDWNGLLKSLPFFGNSSNLLRWFSAYILPAIIGGAIALDVVTKARPRATWGLAGAGMAIILLTTALADHGYYGPHHLGIYDPSALDGAWHVAEDKGAPPPIFAIATMKSPDGGVLMAPERDNALTVGLSQFLCYEPLFGYRLEKFPRGALHRGRATDEADGRLNFKNPACYVFPGANQCIPGDQFLATDRAKLNDFLAYKNLDFAKPWWATAADCLGLITFLASLLGLGVATGTVFRSAIRRRRG
jgi:hypothetical protein